jgi:hypothetical protein
MPEGIVEGMLNEIIDSRPERDLRIFLTPSLRGWTKRPSRRPRESSRAEGIREEIADARNAETADRRMVLQSPTNIQFLRRTIFLRRP